ncbi:MAG TPA: hypothetical protein VGN20_14575 [Mucilaginibacter sp.]|jgi:hypothetical protein
MIPNIKSSIRTLFLSVFFIFTFFSSKTTFAQIIDTPIEHYVFAKDPKPFIIKVVKGRVIGMSLENLNGVTVSNTRTAEKVITNNLGFYQLNVAKYDTITFESPGHSKELRVIKRTNENLNVILIKRKTDTLSPGSEEYKKAGKADNELYRILEKDAKLEGKWNY